VQGPLVGKNAIAQSCVEALAQEGKHCFYFLLQTQQTNRVFTFIAYQLATKCLSITDTFDCQILNDSTILNAARSVQFEELLVKPLRQVTS